MEEKERSNKERGVIRLMLIGLVVIVLVHLGYFILLNNNVLKHYATPENGVIGDTFGAINSLFSALAFLVIAASLYLQNREFRLQREELELQRKEFKAVREEQANSQEAQRREMQLTRELHVRSNFEGRLMFLLKNLERVIQETKGEFLAITQYSTHKRMHEGIEYFDQVHFVLSYLAEDEFDDTGFDFDPPLNQPDDIMASLLKYYLLEDMRTSYLDGVIEPEHYNLAIVSKINGILQHDLYHANTTFLMVIDALQREYDAWIEDGFGTPGEIDRHFRSYIYLFKSSMPHSAFVYFVYVRALPNGNIPYSPIHKMLVERLRRQDFLHKKHMSTLLAEPEVSTK